MGQAGKKQKGAADYKLLRSRARTCTVERGARPKDRRYANSLERLDVVLRNSAAENDEYVHGLVLFEECENARHNHIVCSRKNTEADTIDVLLDGSMDDHLRSLPQAGVDDLHAGIAQGTSDNFRAAVMAIKAGLGHEDTDRWFTTGLIGDRHLLKNSRG